MLSALAPEEQEMPADLPARIVRAGDDWPETVTDPVRDLPCSRATEPPGRPA